MSLKVGGSNGSLTIDQGSETDLTITSAQLKRLVAEQARTWQDMTASRVAQTNYTNDTGYDISIFVMANSTSSASVGNLIDGISFVFVSSIEMKIPAGSVYSMNPNTGLNKWLELR